MLQEENNLIGLYNIINVFVQYYTKNSLLFVPFSRTNCFGKSS